MPTTHFMPDSDKFCVVNRDHGEMEVIEFGDLSEVQRAELEGDEDDPFEAARNDLDSWRAKDRHVGLLGADGRLRASTGMVLAEIQVDGGSPIPAGRRHRGDPAREDAAPYATGWRVRRAGSGCAVTRSNRAAAG